MGCKAKYARCVRHVRQQGKSERSAKAICGWSLFGRKKKRKKRRV